MLTKLKHRVQLWMTAEAELIHSVGLTPNQVSAIGIVFAVLSALAYWKWRLHFYVSILAPLLLVASGFCDAVDGVLARLYGEATTFGGFLDSLLDRYADAIVFCGVILGRLCDLSWGLAALTGSLMVSYVRARAEAAGVKMETVGIAERAERLVILAVASFLSIAWFETLSWGILILAVLTNITVLQRVIYFLRAPKQKEE